MTTATVYALATERSQHLAEQFLDHFLPSRETAADEFEYPQYDDDAATRYEDIRELLRRLELDSESPYSLYWNAKDRHCDVQQAMIFFTNDGGMIVGLAVPENESRKTLENINTLLQPEWALVTGDEAPPISAQQFKESCKAAMLPRILASRLMA